MHTASGPPIPALRDPVIVMADGRRLTEVRRRLQYIRDAMFDRLKQHFSEERIVELTLRTALWGFFNRFNDALQIGVEEGVVAALLAQGASEDILPKHAAK